MDLPAELAPYESVLGGALPVPVAEPLAVLSTKLGGVPDLPPQTRWPDGARGEPLPQLTRTDAAPWKGLERGVSADQGRVPGITDRQSRSVTSRVAGVSTPFARRHEGTAEFG